MRENGSLNSKGERSPIPSQSADSYSAIFGKPLDSYDSSLSGSPCRSHNTCLSTRSLLSTPFTQNLVCNLASTGSLLEMQYLRPHPKPFESEPAFQQDFQMTYIHINRCCVCGAKSRQSCLTLCDRVDCSWPGPSIHGILQARTHVSCLLQWREGSLPLVPPGKIHCCMEFPKYLV